MNDRKLKDHCFMLKNGKSCIKTSVAKKHLPYYECEKCIWRIQSDDPRHLASLQKIFDRYADKH